MILSARILVLMIAAAVAIELPPQNETKAIFHDAFVAVMEQEPGEWQLQSARSDGVREPHEEMVWRQRGNDKAFVRMMYWRYSSENEARAALQRYREILPVATYEVKGFADEAFAPGDNSWRFRRGAFVFQISARDFVSGRPRTIEPGWPASIPLATRFLEAVDRVLMARTLNKE